jgi:hypothetical protein
MLSQHTNSKQWRIVSEEGFFELLRADSKVIKMSTDFVQVFFLNFSKVVKKPKEIGRDERPREKFKKKFKAHIGISHIVQQTTKTTPEIIKSK